MNFCLEYGRPKVMDIFEHQELLDKIGIFNQKNEKTHSFMIPLISSILSKFKIEGKENIDLLSNIIDEQIPLIIISNHTSHLDAPTLFTLMHSFLGNVGKKIADRMVFIAGRLAFIENFSPPAAYMFDSILICSQRDMIENVAIEKFMKKVNMRSYRYTQRLQEENKVIAFFPEGTRSRTGCLQKIMDSSFNYLVDKIVIPVGLEEMYKILSTEDTIIKNHSNNLIQVGKPMLIGKLEEKYMKKLHPEIENVEILKTREKRKKIS